MGKRSSAGKPLSARPSTEPSARGDRENGSEAPLPDLLGSTSLDIASSDDEASEAEDDDPVLQSGDSDGSGRGGAGSASDEESPGDDEFSDDRSDDEESEDDVSDVEKAVLELAEATRQQQQQDALRQG